MRLFITQNDILTHTRLYPVMGVLSVDVALFRHSVVRIAYMVRNIAANELLITEVANRPVLYDVTRSDYH